MFGRFRLSLHPRLSEIGLSLQLEIRHCGKNSQQKFDTFRKNVHLKILNSIHECEWQLCLRLDVGTSCVFMDKVQLNVLPWREICIKCPRFLMKQCLKNIFGLGQKNKPNLYSLKNLYLTNEILYKSKQILRE